MYNSTKIELKIYKPKEYPLVNQLFNDIIKNQKIDKNELRIVTASLFFSMLPLHQEDEERMIILGIVGSFILYNHPIINLI